jgi:hypothetical protein
VSPDWRKFLTVTVELVLPYLGGTRIDTADRPLRIDGEPPELGWWTWRVAGRRATPVARVPSPDLASLPAVRGHWAEGWIFSSGRDADRVALAPEDEPPPLARVTGRRWHSGHVLFGSTDFEDSAEDEARRALERREAIGDVKGATPSLRAAFGFALVAAIGRDIDVPISPREARGAALAIAEAGPAAALELLHRLRAEREQAVQRAKVATAASTARSVTRRSGDPVERADAALEAAGARMLACRRIGGNLEVTFECDGARIISVVDGETLTVYDAGFCISGHDEELTLDSLPSVVREAIEVDHINITRHR